MKKTAYIYCIILFMCANNTHCMQKKENTLPNVCVKLDALPVMNIPLDIVLDSNTLYKAYCWKERLRIPAEKPILMHNITPEEFVHFGKAVYKSWYTFEEFFNKLSTSEKKTLMSLSGPALFDSPRITALIAQHYLPADIIEKHIMPHMNKEEIKHYLQCIMVAQNMRGAVPDLPSFYNFTKNSRMFSAPNGIVHQIPAYFKADSTACTTNNPHKQLLENDQANRYIQKKMDYGDYCITKCIPEFGGTTVTDIAYRADNQEYKHCYLNQKHLNHVICNPNGRYIAMSIADPTNQLQLLTVDPHVDGFITSTITLPDSLEKHGSFHFNNLSTALYELSRDRNSQKSQIIIYDLINDTKKYISLDCSGTIMTFNRHDSRMITEAFITPDDYHLVVWNTSDILNPCILHIIPINAADIINGIHYNHQGNIAVAQSNNGNLYFIEESQTGTITTTRIEHHVTNNVNKVASSKKAALLFTPDDNFVISHIDYSPEHSAEQSDITTWSTQQKKVVAHYEAFALWGKHPEIIMSLDERFLLINQRFFPWFESRLYSPQEAIVLSWIDTVDFLTLYGLNRLYRAHQQHEDLILDGNDIDNDLVIKELLPNILYTPSLMPYIKEYLVIQHKKSLLETMETNAKTFAQTCENAFDSCVSFFKNLGNKK